MPYSHDAHLANIVTSYCTCLAGILPMLYCLLAGRQPARWFFAYFCILLTGIPTVWMHSMEGYQGVRLAAFFDVGSNIFLAWALQVAASGDFMEKRKRRILLGVATPINAAILCYLAWQVTGAEKRPLIQFGEFGQFYLGEVALIANCWVVVGIFAVYRRVLPAAAKPLLAMTVLIFLAGMTLATAANDTVSGYIFPWHAVWHILGMAGFITLWLFNHLRFNAENRSL